METRPSSALRERRLRALIEEFAARDMGYAGVAVFLNCSTSAARNYVHSLVDERLIEEAPAGCAASSEERTVFRLHSLAQPIAAPARRDPLVAALFGDVRRDQSW
jgi:hypothetical protein